MASYVTSQRKNLMEFLKSHPDTQFSVKEIIEQINIENISVSSVYRNLSELEKQGVVTRCAKKGSRDSYYRYSNAEHCKECIHLTCLSCSKIFHLNSTIADSMTNALLKTEGFTVKRPNTVIYGVCKNCNMG